MKEKKIRAFAIDDDLGDLEILRRHLEDIADWHVEFTPFSQWEQGMKALEQKHMDVLFVDYFLGRTTGLEVISTLREKGEKRPIIALTGQGSEKIAAEITRAGADDYLSKDELTPSLLKRTISNLMERFKSVEEKALLEKQLQEAQKMETLGTLAGGIAHDFNNLLMSIMGYADFARIKSEGREIEADLQHIIDTCRQMSELVGQLLSFSRKEKDKISSINVAQTISNAINILQHTLPKKIELVLEKPAHKVSVKANVNLLNQIILNLCINASDAMPEGGKIHIKYRYYEVDTAYALSHPDISAGEYVRIEVSDTGEGMTREIMKRIFDPFFTTKNLDNNKGTGLGLSIVWNNVKKMDGAIDVDSEVGKGTVFTLYLPSGKKTSEVSYPTDAKEILGKNEVILVVDDEKLILNLAKKMLTRMNYKVYIADSGGMALDTFRELEDEIDLIILDISMPAMNGRECLRRLKALNADVKVIFSSGHDLTSEVDALKALGASGLIQKPYLMTDLGTRIRSVLNS